MKYCPFILLVFFNCARLCTEATWQRRKKEFTHHLHSVVDDETWSETCFGRYGRLSQCQSLSVTSFKTLFFYNISFFFFLFSFIQENLCNNKNLYRKPFVDVKKLT